MSSKTVNILWQIAYMMSSLNIACLGIDNVIAISAPFFYEKIVSRQAIPLTIVACLWLTIAIGVSSLHFLGISESQSVQIGVSVVILTLILLLLLSYAFICTQAQLVHLKITEQALSVNSLGSANSNSLKSTVRWRGFATSAILVFAFFCCWAPLVGYLVIDENTLAAAHLYFNRYLVIALLLLHFNSLINPVCIFF